MPSYCCNGKDKRPTSRPVLDNCLDLIHGFYREVFGSFVPGAITASFFVLLPLLTYLSLSNNDIYVELKQLMGLDRVTGGNSTLFANALMLLFIILSYAIGGILYRRAPKYLDAVASFRQWCFSSKEEKKQLTVQFKGKKSDFREKRNFKEYKFSLSAIKEARGFWQHCLELFVDLTIGGGREDLILRGNNPPVSYPYPYLRSYLLQRGFARLAQYVGWCNRVSRDGKQLENLHSRRSKNSINLLKYRIRYYGSSDMIHELDRNECNIRMLNSLWFAFRFVRTIIFICLLAMLADGVWEIVKLVRNDNWVGMATEFAMLAVGCEILVGVSSGELLQLIGCKLCAGESPVLKSVRVVRLVQLRLPCVAWGIGAFICALAVISFGGHIWFAAGLVWLFYAVTFCRRNIEKGFHYVRERELIYILSSADILDSEMGCGIFAEVKEATRKAAQEMCNGCTNFENCYCSQEEFKAATGAVDVGGNSESPS